MAKILSFIVSFCIVTNLVLTIPADDNVGELIAGTGLLKGYLKRRLLLNLLLGDIEDRTVDFICSQLGAGFFQAIISFNNCQFGAKLHCALNSHKDFCELYRRLCPDPANCCLTDKVVQAKLEIPGIVKMETAVGRCCKSCDSSPSQNSVLGANANSLLDGGVSNDYLVGGLIKNVEDGVTGLLCSFLRPGFLQVLTGSKKCQAVTLLRDSIDSCEKFCLLYDQGTPDVKEGISDTVIRIAGDVVVDNGNTEIGRCCAHCASKNKKCGDNENRPQNDTISVLKGPNLNQ